MVILFLILQYVIAWIRYFNNLDSRLGDSTWRWSYDYQVIGERDISDLDDKAFVRLRRKRNKIILLMYSIVFIMLIGFPELITRMFTTDSLVIEKTPTAMCWVFAATPIIAVQLIGSAYFQAVGKAVPALLLTLSRQGFFFIPLIFILPLWYGELGVWMAFPVSDVLSTLLTVSILYKEVSTKLISKP